MLEVVSRDENGALKPLRFETNAVEVMDGALIVYSYGGKYPIAGLAPGQWVSFQMLGGDDATQV